MDTGSGTCDVTVTLCDGVSLVWGLTQARFNQSSCVRLVLVASVVLQY